MESKEIQAAAASFKALISATELQIKMLQGTLVNYKMAYDGLMRAGKTREKAEARKMMDSLQKVIDSARKAAQQADKMESHIASQIKMVEKQWKIAQTAYK